MLLTTAVRVVEVRGRAGFVELTQTVAPVILCAYALVVAERYQAHPLANILFWPSPKFRRLLVLAIFAVVDFYLVLIFALGERFAGAVGI